MSKIRLLVRCRKQGCYVASVPIKQLNKLAAFGKRRWDFKPLKDGCKDGWLILEAM